MALQHFPHLPPEVWRRFPCREVNKMECCFGFLARMTRPGVCWAEDTSPASPADMGYTKRSRSEGSEIVDSLSEKYPGDDHDLLGLRTCLCGFCWKTLQFLCRNLPCRGENLMVDGPGKNHIKNNFKWPWQWCLDPTPLFYVKVLLLFCTIDMHVSCWIP